MLGTLLSNNDRDRFPAILRIEGTALDPSAAENIISWMTSMKIIGRTDIYSWLFGWLEQSIERPNVKITVICPATDVHIQKYTKQQYLMVRETPELYGKVVKPYIASFPAERTQWVEDVLSGKSEVDKVLYDDSDFVILPDMKWDLTTVSALYLLAIVRDTTLKSLRDLRKHNLQMLKRIQAEASRVVREKWGVQRGQVMFFVHYQPSYYHFHVHIVNANLHGHMGMRVGQAHLLEDVISLLEIDNDLEGLSIFERITLTYGLGNQHGLFEKMKLAQV